MRKYVPNDIKILLLESIRNFKFMLEQYLKNFVLHL